MLLSSNAGVSGTQRQTKHISATYVEKKRPVLRGRLINTEFLKKW